MANEKASEKGFFKRADIERHLAYVNSLFEWSPVPFSSILRVPSYSYQNWHIKINPGNEKWLYDESRKAYYCEWGPTDESLNRLVSIASSSEKAGLGDVNAIMNKKVGEISAQYANENFISKNRPISLLDIGSGAGATVVEFIKSLGAAALGAKGQISITLLEPSAQRLALALENATTASKDHLPGMEITFSTAQSDVLVSLSASSYHLAISNAAIHHNSFNFHLGHLIKALKGGGAFVNGDWHCSIWQSPAKFYWLAMLLADQSADNFNMVKEFVLNGGLPGRVLPAETKEIAGKKEIMEFKKYFSISDDSLLRAFDGSVNGSRQADWGMLSFWSEVGRVFSEKGAKSPIHIPEAHEPAVNRKASLILNGFTFDSECQSKYFEMLRNRGKGELATVMMAKKPIKR
ncbi:MAG: class I SAM-dependent methyltransferase [Candidatus Micrarchaeia archaeon]